MGGCLPGVCIEYGAQEIYVEKRKLLLTCEMGMLMAFYKDGGGREMCALVLSPSGSFLGR